LTIIELFVNSVSCEGISDLPVIAEFKNLHLTESLKEIKNSIDGIAGIYCISNQETSQIYIGSSINIWDRFYAHIINSSSNLYLQESIWQFGLAAFTLKVVEFCAKDQLLLR